MDLLELALFLFATFAGALVAGLSGFAFGLVAASIWLYILTPLQTATLIIAFGLIVQGYCGLETAPQPRLDKALAVRAGRRPRRARRRLHPDLGQSCACAHRRRACCWFSTASMRCFARRSRRSRRPAPVADAGAGFLNGVLGGITGLAGILVTIWCGLRGWPKDVQRTVFQPVAVAIFLMSALWIGARGAITPDTIKLFLIGLPALLAGTWLGLKLFGRLDEAAFRKVVLVLLLASGVVLVLEPSERRATLHAQIGSGRRNKSVLPHSYPKPAGGDCTCRELAGRYPMGRIRPSTSSSTAWIGRERSAAKPRSSGRTSKPIIADLLSGSSTTRSA